MSTLARATLPFILFADAVFLLLAFAAYRDIFPFNQLVDPGFRLSLARDITGQFAALIQVIFVEMPTKPDKTELSFGISAPAYRQWLLSLNVFGLMAVTRFYSSHYF